MLEYLFIYPKARGTFLRLVYNQHALSRRMMDILLYIRYFGNSDGWVMNRELKEYMSYEIWVKRHKQWKWTMYSLIEKGLIQMRTRQSAGKSTRKMLTSNELRSGSNIEYKLTAKGTLLMLDFDKVATEYINTHIHNKKAISIGADKDIFNL